MSDDETISRRTALKIIAVGVGATTASPAVLGQHAGMDMRPTPAASTTAQQPRFFDVQEMETISIIADLILPSDEHSPGAKEAGVPSFIDLIVSESPVETRAFWRNGIVAINKLSEKEFAKTFNAATVEQQVSLLKAISKNEYKPTRIEERFFIAIKGLTVDGYYTSQIGIHQELQYKGNAYLKNFVGCTHPEHTS
jgi:gluconate 2-dehydrogenase gamma chain